MVFRYEAPRPPNKVITHAGTFLGIMPDGDPNVGYPDHRLEAHGSGIERTIPAEMPQGEYLVFVYVRDPQGEVPYEFRVKVE